LPSASSFGPYDLCSHLVTERLQTADASAAGNARRKCYALRTTTLKLVKYPNRPEWTEAFDLAADPYEIKNLASDSKLTAKLETELTAMMTTVKYTPPANANKPREADIAPAIPKGN
jgi:hypothetical protein